MSDMNEQDEAESQEQSDGDEEKASRVRDIDPRRAYEDDEGS